MSVQWTAFMPNILYWRQNWLRNTLVKYSVLSLKGISRVTYCTVLGEKTLSLLIFTESFCLSFSFCFFCSWGNTETWGIVLAVYRTTDRKWTTTVHEFWMSINIKRNVLPYWHCIGMHYLMSSFLNECFRGSSSFKVCAWPISSTQ